MNMIEKMKLMMTERKLTIAKVSRGTELPYSTVDNVFKRGYKNASCPTIHKLAKFFDVPMEYLINEEVSPMLTNEEYAFIALWRQLPRDEQIKISDRIELKLGENK